MPKRTRRSKLTVTLLPTDPFESAKIAGLRYACDEVPGIRRKRSGRGWSFVGPDGSPVRDRAEIRRIHSLVIPPAWTDVWISPDPKGHLQAVGFDARGRKQYRYHPLYRKVRDATKFTRMVAFGLVLPKIRERADADLKGSGLSKNKVLATIVQLLEQTCIRVGNEEYTKQNDSFGLTTLRDEHVEIEGKKIRFHFRGKSGQEHDIELRDRRLARIVYDCQCIPGQELFQYIGDDGENHKITSGDVNDYLREITGQDFTAKDFRTWVGTTQATLVLEAMGPGETQSDSKKNIVAAIKETAAKLGNRPATCKKYYVHPAVLDAYQNGTLFQVLADAKSEPDPFGLKREEVAVMRILASYETNPLGKGTADEKLPEVLKKSVAQLAKVAQIEVVVPNTAPSAA
jgi:DNA topoisomerase-1